MSLNEHETDEMAREYDVLSTDEVCGESDDQVDELGFDEVVVDEIGRISFKKLGKFVKKAAKTVIKSPLINPIETIRMTAKFVAKNPIAAILPPVGVYKLLREARKKKPVAVAKVEAIKEAAQEGDLTAKQAYEGLVLANETEKEGVVPEEVFEDYPADDVPYEDYMADQIENPEYDQVGSFWSTLKKIGPALDISNPKNPLRVAAAQIPFVGPGVVAASDMLAKAKGGAKDAIAKVNQIKALAAKGNADGKAALTNLHTANALDKAGEVGANAALGARKVYDWLPGIKTYRDGTNKEIAVMGPDKKMWFPLSGLYLNGVRKGTGLKTAKL